MKKKLPKKLGNKGRSIMKKIRSLELRDFSRLLIYQKSMNWAMRIRELTGTFPNDEWKDLTLKILKSSNRVPALIARGNSQFYLAEERESYRKAFNKVKETQDLLKGAFQAEYISERTFVSLNEKTEEVLKLTMGMIKRLRVK
jgi:four helix bundle protein